MSKKKLLLKSLEACEKFEFDKVVKTYLKEVFGFETVINTDGTGDSGIDIKVFNAGEQKVQYQLTTQESDTTQEKNSFTRKITEDFEKAKKNTMHGYSNELYFFYSKKLINSRIHYFETLALKDYGISLKLIEANRIAEEAEEFIELQRVIINISELDKIQLESKSFQNEEKNLIFELVGFGNPSELRFKIIESYFIQVLFQKKELSITEVTDHLNFKFKTSENAVFYDKLLSRLMSERKITKTEDKTKFKLTEGEAKNVTDLYQRFELEDQLFTKEITEILSKYNQESFTSEYVSQLRKIYTENFNNDISGILTNSTSSELTGVSSEFKYFIESKVSSKQYAKTLAIELLKYCQENKFLQKFCASKVFSEKTNLKRLELYVNSKKRIFIDTQIALHILCFYFNSKCDYDNYFYQISKGLLLFSRTNKTPLYIFERYLWEVQTHIRLALNLIPFTTLPDFNKLGKSRNVFYNFFLYLSDNGLTESKNYESFMSNAGFNVLDSFKIHQEKVDYYFSQLNIHKIEAIKDYNIDEVKGYFINALSELHKNKTSFSLNNDSIMVEFLSDKDTDVHPLEPVFVSWDKSFFKVREKYYKNHPNGQRWFLFTPSKLIDHYSVLKFSIDSETVTRDLLALLSDEIINKTYILLDSLSIILNPNDEIGLEYTNKFAQIRDEEIHKISSKDFEPLATIEGETALDEVMYHVTSHFIYDEQKQNYFKRIFTEKELLESVFKIVTESVTSYYQNKRFDKKTITDFDVLINRLKEEDKRRITQAHKQ